VALWIAAEANPKEVSVRAGHTSVACTLDRYGHLFPGHDDELRDRLDAMQARASRPFAAGRWWSCRAAPARPTAKASNEKDPALYRV
jgi:hypothetical protein